MFNVKSVSNLQGVKGKKFTLNSINEHFERSFQCHVDGINFTE